MTPAQATVEVFWTAYQALPEEERSSLLEKIMSEDVVFEDYLDNKAVTERKAESSVPLEEYLQKRSARKTA